MSNQVKVNAEEIHFIDIKTIKGNINGSSSIDSAMIHNHHFEFEFSTGLNIEEQIVGLQFVVNIDAVDKNEQRLDVKGSYTHELIFKVDQLRNFLEEKKNDQNETEYFIESSLGSVLVSIAYSTIRGIIFVRTQGTSLGTVILPIIDPKKLME